jgi:hypothetical protein
LTAAINDFIPKEFAGIGVNYSSTVDFFTPQFAQVISNFTNRVPVDTSQWGCNGTCVGHVTGAGFKPVCQQSINSSFLVYSSPSSPYATLFNINFGWDADYMGSNDKYNNTHLTLATLAAITQISYTSLSSLYSACFGAFSERRVKQLFYRKRLSPGMSYYVALIIYLTPTHYAAPFFRLNSISSCVTVPRYCTTFRGIVVPASKIE